MPPHLDDVVPRGYLIDYGCLVEMMRSKGDDNVRSLLNKRIQGSQCLLRVGRLREECVCVVQLF